MEDSSAGKKRKLGSCPRELPTLPPFTGTLEFIPTQPKQRKSETLVLLPTKSSESSPRSIPREREVSNWSSGCALAGAYYSNTGERRVGRENAENCNEAQSTRALLRVAEELVVGLESAVEKRGSHKEELVLGLESTVEKRGSHQGELVLGLKSPVEEERGSSRGELVLLESAVERGSNRGKLVLLESAVERGSNRGELVLALESAVERERGSNRGSSARTSTEMEGEKAAVILAAEELVQKVMGAWDSSHDPFHALRVRDLALSLASEEGLRLSSFLIVELAALLHDIDDHKYAARGDKVGNTVESFLKDHNVESNTAEAVLKIVTTIGFKEELGGSGNGPISPEFAVVQDADRLDAIGAIGIARTFTYGGSRNRKMHDPAQAPRTSLTKADYAGSDAHPTTINHFAEKLLKLKGLMKSQAGKKRAMQRHEFMVSFLEQFHREWEGKY